VTDLVVFLLIGCLIDSSLLSFIGLFLLSVGLILNRFRLVLIALVLICFDWLTLIWIDFG
jgi:hypothetical protein